MSTSPTPGAYRPGPPPGARPGPPPAGPLPPIGPVDGREAPTDPAGHPAVDAAIQAIVNAADLSPADQIAQYEAAHRTLQETLATIDQA